MAFNINTSSNVVPDLEVLRNAVNSDVTASIVIDASAVATGADGTRKLLAGTPMTKNANNQYERYVSSSATNYVQTLFNSATSGTFTMTTGGHTTAATAFNATPAVMKSRIEALVHVLHDVEVTGSGTSGDPWIITFEDAGEAAPITTNDGSLVGGTSTVSRATPAIAGILCRTEVFPDGSSKSDIPSAMWVHGQWFRPDRIVDWNTLGTAIKAALPTCKFS